METLGELVVKSVILESYGITSRFVVNLDYSEGVNQIGLEE